MSSIQAGDNPIVYIILVVLDNISDPLRIQKIDFIRKKKGNIVVTFEAGICSAIDVNIKAEAILRMNNKTLLDL